MLCKTGLNKAAISLVALVAIFALSGSGAEAQVKPFKVTGGGVADYVPVVPNVAVFHFATGNATGLGNYTGGGKLQLNQFTGPLTAEFSSAEPFVFTAANGDDLAFTYGVPENGAAQAGEVELFPQADGRVIAVWVAEFNPVAELSTGRFEKVVDGSFIMIATTEPFVLGSNDPVPYTWEGEGTLTYREGK